MNNKINKSASQNNIPQVPLDCPQYLSRLNESRRLSADSRGIRELDIYGIGLTVRESRGSRRLCIPAKGAMMIRKPLETGEEVARASAKSPSLGSGPSRRWVQQQAICWQNNPFSQPVVDTWRYTGRRQLPNKVMAGKFFYFSDAGPDRTVYGSSFLMPETPELCEQRATT